MRHNTEVHAIFFIFLNFVLHSSLVLFFLLKIYVFHIQIWKIYTFTNL
jgi:hypothetical protein